MRKLLISILVILLLVLTYFVVMQNVTIADWTSKNVDDIKELNKNLDDKINIAKQLSNQDYPESISNLERSIDNLKKAKEKYENKKEYLSGDSEIGKVEIREYDVERLWVALGNYAKKEQVEIKLDILEAGGQNVYDLDITLIGDYIPITDFIYDVEKDDTLGFKIVNFKLEHNSAPTTDANTLKATFKIQGVGIRFN